MATPHDGAQRHELLRRLVAYEGRAQVLRTFSLTDEQLAALLDGGPWDGEVWRKFQRAWEPYADFDTAAVIDEVGTAAASDGDYVGEDGGLGVEAPDDVAPGEAEPAEALAATEEDAKRKRTRARLVKARLIILAALYAEHLRRHEKLAAFRPLLLIESVLIEGFGETLPVLGEVWGADRLQSEIEKRQRLTLTAARAQSRMQSGLRGLANWAMGRSKTSEADLHRILETIERNPAAFMGMNSDPRVLTGAYLRWDWDPN